MTTRTRISLWVLGIAIFLFWSYAMFVAWSSPVFVVFGFVRDADGEPQDGWAITVQNVTKGWESDATTGEVGDPGSYQVTRIELMGDSAADAGDVIRVTAIGPDGKRLTETVTLTEESIVAATLEVSFGSDVAPPPRLTSVTPDSVSESGGETLVLEGTGFIDGATLLLRRTHGNVEEGISVELTVENETTATATLPALAPGAWTIELTNPDGQSATLENALVVEEAVPEDLTGDGIVDIADLVLVARDFGAAGAGLQGDVNGDGIVNIVDLVLIAQRFGESLFGAPIRQPLYAGTVRTEAVASLAEPRVSLSLRLAEFSGDLSGLAAYDVRVAFDPATWRLVDLGDGTLFGGNGRVFRHVSTPTENASGQVRLVAVALDEVPAAGDEFARLTFERIGNGRSTSSPRVVRATVADRAARTYGLKPESLRWNLRLTSAERTLVGRNYPNPFNPETWIPYQLAESTPVTIRIYDASGSLVRTLDLGIRPAGGYVTRDRAAYWDGRNAEGERVASGLYFYEFEAGRYRASGRMLVLK